MTTLTAMPKYEAYKDSGVEWIGEIPIHWELKKLKFISFINKQSLPENTSRNLTLEYVDIGSVTLEKGIEKVESFSFSDAPSRARRMANEGDTVVSTVRTYLKAIAYVDDISSKYIYSTGFAVITPKCLKFSKYLTSFIKSDAFTKQVDDVAKGMSYPAINSTDLSNLFIAEPPESEHISIANFLDEKIAKIDEAITIKEKQIELLKERKQIIIQQAVTQGLDPTVPMKDSGVEWIGQIPAHWEMKPLKLHLKKIIDNRGRTPAFGDNGIPMLEVKNITDGDLYPTEQFDKFVIPSVVEKYERDKVAIGDVLISTVGATSGKTVLIKNSPTYFICQNVVGLRPDIDLGSEFLNYTLSAVYFKTSLQMINKGNTIDNLKVSVFINNTIVMPPLQEQEKIAAHIELESRKTNNAIDILINQINKLKEYKTTLINSAVTGKIKVV